jgi:hypothetical protein
VEPCPKSTLLRRPCGCAPPDVPCTKMMATHVTLCGHLAVRALGWTVQ